MNFKKNDLFNDSLEQKKLERDSLFSHCVFYQDRIIAFTNFKKIPIIQDLNTGDMILLNDLINYDAQFAADYMVNSGDDIFALELNGNRLMKCNITNKMCQYFEINCNKRNWGNYALLAYCDKKVYVFPRYGNEWLKVDTETGKVQRDKSLYLKLNGYKMNTEQSREVAYLGCGCQSENIAWLFPNQGNVVVAYDMRFDTWQEHLFSEELDNCVSVMPYGDKLYILSSKGIVYSWSIRNELIEVVVDCNSADGDCTRFGRFAVTDKRIYLLPALGEDIFYMDIATKQINKYESYPKGFRYCGPKDWSKYYGYCEDEKHYYFAMRSMNYFLIVNKRDGEIKWIKPKLPSSEEYERIYIKYGNGLYREIECGIKSLLVYPMGNIEDSNKHMVGEDIWKQMKREC